MAHPARNPPQSSGLLSGVFSFVSREIESFVTNATGKPPLEEPHAPPALRPKRRKNLSNAPPARSKRDHTIARAEQRDPSSSPKPYHRGETAFKHANTLRRRSLTPTVCQDMDETLSATDISRSPSPMPLPRFLRRRPSITMPGSLFPRSPSMDPDFRANETTGLDRHVRFAPGIVSPSYSRQPFRDPDYEAGPSHHPSSTSKAHEPDPQVHPRMKPSIQTAVERFHDDEADPSILLPSPTHSPVRAAAKGKARQRDSSIPSEEGRLSPTPGRDKGKQRAKDTSAHRSDADTAEESRVRGKERELLAAREEQRSHEKRWERDKDGDALRIEEADREKARDKEKIRTLEREILWLKEELSKRPSRGVSLPPAPPAPPPPPPPSSAPMQIPLTSSDTGALFASARASLKHAPTPMEAPINPPAAKKRQGQPTVGLAPDKMAAFLSEMKTVRLRKVLGGSAPTTSGPSHLAWGSEGLGRSLSIQDSLRRSTASKQLDLASSTSSLNGWHRDDSNIRVGEKRKRDIHGLPDFQDDLHAAVKRRSIASSSDSSFTSTSTSSSRNTLNSSTMSAPSTSSFSRSFPPPSRFNIPNRPWVSNSLTDAATPSLCSDNDVEREDDTSHDDRLPSTPPVIPSQTSYHHNEGGVTGRLQQEREVIDVDMLPDDPVPSESMAPPPSPPQKSLPSPPRAEHLNTASVFAKRPPTSPLPARSPRKPRAPARASRVVPPRVPADGSDDEDPLSLTFTLREPRPPENDDEPVPRPAHRQQDRQRQAHQSNARSASSYASSRSKQGSGSGGRLKRRQTLDKELRDADLAREEQARVDADFDFGDDSESGVLTGVGTRSKKLGFLAHGGAGGAPVFLGVGYVEGAEEEVSRDRDDDGSHEELQPRRASVKSAPAVSAKRKGRR